MTTESTPGLALVRDEVSQRDMDLFGEDAREWLRRWDSGRPVWSIEMGGLGPGYEQCIQLMAAEFLRYFVEVNPPHANADDYKKLNADFDKHENAGGFPIVSKLDPSGAQFGAAKNLAWMLYTMGPCGVMNDPQVKDRHIQVSNHFPTLS